VGQHVGQEIVGVAQPVEQGDVAQIGDPGLGGEARHAAQRQAARPVEQGEMQQVGGAAHAALAQEGAMLPGGGGDIHHRADLADHARPMVQAGRCALRLLVESSRGEPCQSLS
jgi:hypothetical protein